MSYRYPFAFFALAFCASAWAAIFSVEATDLVAEIRAARQEGRRLAVLVELPDCPDCLSMKRRVFSDPGVEKRFGQRYRTRWIRFTSPSPVVDAAGARRTPAELAHAWGVFAAPSFVFFDEKGHLEYRHTGSLAHPADFLALGRFVSDAIYEKQPFSDYLHSRSCSEKQEISP
jgi:thioredoxin-related protein